MLVWLSGWSIGTSFLLHQAYNNWFDVFTGPSKISSFFSAVITTMFALPFTAGWFFGFYIFQSSMPLWAGVALAIGGVPAYAFYHLLKAPTALGAHTMDQIDGFKLFLETAEKDRLEILNPPNVTPALFESFLPYAIALDCENQWSKKFEPRPRPQAWVRTRITATRRSGIPAIPSRISAWRDLPHPSARPSAARPRRPRLRRARALAAAEAASPAAGAVAAAAAAGSYFFFLGTVSIAIGPGPIPTSTSSAPAIAILRAKIS